MQTISSKIQAYDSCHHQRIVKKEKKKALERKREKMETNFPPFFGHGKSRHLNAIFSTSFNLKYKSAECPRIKIKEKYPQED